MKFSINLLYICILICQNSFGHTENEVCIAHYYASSIVFLAVETTRIEKYWPAVIISNNKVLSGYCDPRCEKFAYVYTVLNHDPTAAHNYAIKRKVRQAISIEKEVDTPPLSVILLWEEFLYTNHIRLPQKIHSMGDNCVVLTFASESAPFYIKSRDVQIVSNCSTGSFCFSDPDGSDLADYCANSPIICNGEITGISNGADCYNNTYNTTGQYTATSVYEFLNWIHTDMDKLNTVTSNCNKIGFNNSFTFNIIYILLTIFCNNLYFIITLIKI